MVVTGYTDTKGFSTPRHLVLSLVFVLLTYHNATFSIQVTRPRPSTTGNMSRLDDDDDDDDDANKQLLERLRLNGID